jgi:hypothetical protein
VPIPRTLHSLYFYNTLILYKERGKSKKTDGFQTWHLRKINSLFFDFLICRRRLLQNGLAALPILLIAHRNPPFVNLQSDSSGGVIRAGDFLKVDPIIPNVRILGTHPPPQ